ncbi:hypothetical protein MN210_18575 [Psychrobacter raelei]|uniref:Uncharacterized protein n=1 Tax=Psychrobacter raelei TaxID=2565531 RepID=A0AAU6PUB0_9GAMM
MVINADGTAISGKAQPGSDIDTVMARRLHNSTLMVTSVDTSAPLSMAKPSATATDEDGTTRRYRSASGDTRHAPNAPTVVINADGTAIGRSQARYYYNGDGRQIHNADANGNYSVDTSAAPLINEPWPQQDEMAQRAVQIRPATNDTAPRRGIMLMAPIRVRQAQILH